MVTSRSSDRETTGGGLLASDELFRALASRPRRRLVAFVLDVETSSSGELVSLLCGWELDEDVLVTPERRRELSVRLHHVHLPVLEEAGLVSYDAETERVDIESLDEPVRDLVRAAIRAEDR